MKNSLALLVIGLFFGTGLGFLLSTMTDAKPVVHDHAMPKPTASGVADHNHGDAVDMGDMANAPTVDIVLHEDEVSGWNLEIITENFEFSPETVNQDNMSGKGHAHIYVNDEKLVRLYSKWMYLDALPSGETTVSVTLNSNDHRVISVNGEHLRAEQTVIVR